MKDYRKNINIYPDIVAHLEVIIEVIKKLREIKVIKNLMLYSKAGVVEGIIILRWDEIGHHRIRK